ncbi:MAG: asparagine synthase (glutamine-hydrolyzing) [Planctomyces sp.]|nr:asparagine synthase (glutamine-hydrolyzing) [Planctomyces sp.]
MCGICGFIQTTVPDAPVPTSADRESRLAAMLASLAHRGPDGLSTFTTEFAGLGHARLAIIDLAGGTQPLYSEDRSLALVANGEIYNHLELRAELISLGHQFRTGSDCEVILHLYEERGAACLDKLHGMFAFAILDTREKTLFAARDRFGQKPFYYRHQEGLFTFASEATALREEASPLSAAGIDPAALDQYLYYQFVPSPRTLQADIHALPAGHALSLKVEDLATDCRLTEFRSWEWWSPPVPVREATSHRGKWVEAGIVDGLEDVLEEAVQSHLLADVPVGLYLSGGIDSTLIGSLAKPHLANPMPAFTISFPGSKMDESEAAACAANHLGMSLEVVEFHPEDFVSLVKESGSILDLPLADAAFLPLLKLSRAASRSVKTVLTGDGGDELFGGYRKYREAARVPRCWQSASDHYGRNIDVGRLLSADGASSPWRRASLWLARHLFPARRADLRKRAFEALSRAEIYQPGMLSRMGSVFETPTRNVHPGRPWLDQALLDDQGTVLADRLLLKGDRSTMAHGVEARAPFLDHRVAEFAAKLPADWIIRGRETKYALRTLARRHLPQEITDRRKKGFSLPLKEWFAGPLAEWLHGELLAPSPVWDELFQRSTVERLLREHRQGRTHHTDRLYTLLSLKLWLRRMTAGAATLATTEPQTTPRHRAA